MKFEELEESIKSCKECSICGTKVYHRGSMNPDVLIIGEAPGKNEEKQGLPFVGLSGKRLDKWIERNIIKNGWSFAITNIVKCRPTSSTLVRYGYGKGLNDNYKMKPLSEARVSNRRPTISEIRNCSKFLKGQIEFYNPKILVCLGKSSMEGISILDEKFYKSVLDGEEDIFAFRYMEYVFKVFDAEIGKKIRVVLVPHPRWYISHGKEIQDFDSELIEEIKEIVEK